MEFVIDIAYFELNTVIDTDFDTNKAENHLVEAHEIQLYELLGKDLYNRVQTILAGTPTTIESELIELLKPFVLKATEVSLVPFLNNPVTAKGTQDRNGNFTTSANDTNSGLVLDSIRGKLEAYAERVRDFLKDNLIDFPEYNKNCTQNGNNFYSSIHGI